MIQAGGQVDFFFRAGAGYAPLDKIGMNGSFIEDMLKAPQF
jgi:hypothetical protein